MLINGENTVRKVKGLLRLIEWYKSKWITWVLPVPRPVLCIVRWRGPAQGGLLPGWRPPEPAGDRVPAALQTRVQPELPGRGLSHPVPLERGRLAAGKPGVGGGITDGLWGGRGGETGCEGESALSYLLLCFTERGCQEEQREEASCRVLLMKVTCCGFCLPLLVFGRRNPPRQSSQFSDWL